MAGKYPMTEEFETAELSFALMIAEDEQELLEFARALPEADLIYLRMDITKPEIIAEWVRNVAEGHSITLLVREDGDIIGYGTLHMNQLTWTRHIGELRILVGARFRKSGVGRSLVTRLYDIAKENKLQRVIIQMPSNQPPMRRTLEELSFEPQAILPDWLRDRHNRRHDLLIMSRNVV